MSLVNCREHCDFDGCCWNEVCAYNNCDEEMRVTSDLTCFDLIFLVSVLCDCLL